MESILAGAPPGASVTVSYNPDDPGASMLVPGAEGWSTLLWTLRGVLAVMVLLGWYWVYRGAYPDRAGRR